MFRSFFFAGFEGTAAVNQQGQWIDQVAATQHDRYADEDYRRLAETGLFAAREAVRWPLVDRGGGRYDFRSVQPFVAASRRHRIDVIWDLFHYGYPRELDPFSPEFVRRFADYCHAAATYLAAATEGPLWFTPVNEPSYLAWAAGDAARFAPHRRGAGRELKVALVRAAIAGIDAIWAAAPAARIVNVDPICNVVPPRDRPDLARDVEAFNLNAVFEAWDMLSGRLYPELGGSSRHLDVIGANYYWTNEWEWGRAESPLAPDDPRRVPLSALLERIADRYGCEILLTETAHVDGQRAPWLRCVADECERAITAGVELRGACLYPVLGMPEWHLPDVWVRMGLWDLVRNGPRLERRLFRPMMDALNDAHRLNDTVAAPALGDRG